MPSVQGDRLAASDTVTVRQVRAGRGLFALVAVRAGARILDLEGEILPVPSVFSLQVGEHEHLHPHRDALAAEGAERCPWRFLNHSCDPNCWIDGRALRARRAIAPGDELTFDYNCTEWSMDSPFDCACEACGGQPVRGYAHLDAGARERRSGHAAPHLIARARRGDG